jgi:hypothetical protein
MKYAPIAMLVVLAGCPNDERNPDRLYFAPDGSETRLKLQEDQPPPW